MTKQCFSIHGEDFDKQDLCEVFEALDSDGQLEGGVTYWVADAVTLTHEDIVKHRIDSLLEDLDSSGYELIGEVFDSEYSEVSKEAKTELKNLIQGWAEKHIDVSRFYFVKNAVEKIITQKEVDEYLE